MTEFDFEEIDRAVTSAMTGPDVSDATTNASDAGGLGVTAPNPVREPVSRRQEITVNVTVKTPKVETLTKTARAIATNHAHQFHQNDTAPVRDTPRPTNPTNLPAVIPDELPALASDVAPKHVTRPVRRVGKFIDVLPPANRIEKEQLIPTLPESEAEEPEEAWTPFLPDAKDKVEKRPLNSGKTQVPISVVASSIENEAITPEQIAHADIDAIEKAAVVVEPETPPVAGTSEEIQSFTSAVPEVAPLILSRTPASVSDEAQDNGAIFDTEHYHKAVVKHQKKLHPIVVILWVIGLIAIGAGVGWVMYAFVLPML